MNTQIEFQIEKRIENSIRTVAESLGIEGSTSKTTDELFAEIAKTDTHSQALIADYANSAHEWLQYSKELEESGQHGYDSPEIAKRLNELSSRRDEAQKALLDHINTSTPGS